MKIVFSRITEDVLYFSVAVLLVCKMVSFVTICVPFGSDVLVDLNLVLIFGYVKCHWF